MPILSKIHAQPGAIQHLVFDVVVDTTPFFAGTVIGKLQNGEPYLSVVGSETMRRLVAAQQAGSANATMHIVEILTPDRVAGRLAQISAAVSRHDAVLFLCSDDATCAAMIQALNPTG